MFSRFFFIVAPFFLVNVSAEQMVHITIGSDAVSSLSENKINNKIIKSQGDVTLMSVPESKIEEISHLMHEKFNRCGGFIYHSNLEKAKKALEPQITYKKIMDYTIGQEAVVNSFIKKANATKIYEVISKLSSFKNRYYRSTYGVDSQTWIKSQWELLVKNRTDARVEFFKHEFSQPSVILTIQGDKNPEDIIILGGHGDSINHVGGGSGPEKVAPGADDNASGIAVLTEIIRVIVDENYKPQNTIKIISYAAEEVGLRGSNEIAERMQNTNSNIVGVMQFDMTNFPGSEGKLFLISDYTNSNQNAFVGKLIDKYIQIPWEFGKCGYACSDHASWTNSGFIASFPFEASMRDYNPDIHTERDTLDKSKDSASFALNFAKLGIAYLVELDK
ncbi:MAG: M20/M25/M40 family metallo-hydrolase [Bacteriovoracales bacterium]